MFSSGDVICAKGSKDAFISRDARRSSFLGVGVARRQTSRERWYWDALDLIDSPSVAPGKGLIKVAWSCRPPDEFEFVETFLACWRLRRLLLCFILGFVGWAALLWAWGGFLGPYFGPKGEWTLNQL